MMTKTQAKGFFLFGTLVCSLAFIGLTVDSIRQIPGQTHAENLTPPVIRGKHLFDSNNCMGCHTILGEGAYYAPELTKVIDRRGEAFVKSMLKDPEAMFPGGRRMTNYHFKDEEISDLVDFLKWIGKIDLNGYPAKPDMALASGAAPAGSAGPVADNRPAVFSQICVACHSLQGKGGQVGPSLDGVGLRRDSQYLKSWLQNPQAVKADSKMPKLPLSESEINDLVAFLSQQKGGQ